MRNSFEESESNIRSRIISICDNDKYDVVSLLENIADVLIDHFADAFSIDLVEDDGTTRQYVTRHVNSDLEIRMKKLYHDYPLLSTAAYGYPRVIKTGKAQFIPGVSSRLAHRLFSNSDLKNTETEIPIRSFICVPLTTFDRTLGALTVITTKRRFTAADFSIVEEAAPIIAKCLDERYLPLKDKSR